MNVFLRARRGVLGGPEACHCSGVCGGGVNEVGGFVQLCISVYHTHAAVASDPGHRAPHL